MMRLEHKREEINSLIERVRAVKDSLDSGSPSTGEIRDIADSLYKTLKWVRGVGYFEVNIAREHGKFLENYNALMTMRSQEALAAERMLKSLENIKEEMEHG